MKAEELMLGDWCFCELNGKPEKVQAIYEDKVMLDYNDLYPYDEIQPIPITKEMLEKNGFEQYGKDAYCLSIPIQMAGDGIEQQDITIHRMKVLELRTSTCTLLMPMKYVHELQHALRLCGITKTIEL